MISSSIFMDEGVYNPPPATEEEIRLTEKVLGFVLPASYISLVRQQNGGLLKRTSFTAITDGKRNYFFIYGIRGVGEEYGIINRLYNDIPMSQYFVQTHGYPSNCVVFFHHSDVGYAFDYDHFIEGEPEIIVNWWPDKIIPLGVNFEGFINGLYDRNEYDL